MDDGDDGSLRCRGVPWWPGGLRDAVRVAADLREHWFYVLVEEIVGDTAELMRWPWPLADQNGRLCWPPGDETRCATGVVGVQLLRRQLYAPNGLLRRPRVGDTFACPGAGPGWDAAAVDDLRALLPGPVYDVSVEAREAAQLAYRGALAAIASDGREGVPAADGARADAAPAPRLRVAAPEAAPALDRGDDLP